MTPTLSELRNRLDNPIPSIRPPFLENGEIDWTGLDTVIGSLIDNGAESLLLTAGDSHYQSLSGSEISDLTRRVGRMTGSRIPWIAADYLCDTARSITLAEEARAAGASLFMPLPPHWGNSLTVESLARHYITVAQILPIVPVTNFLAGWSIERLCALFENVHKALGERLVAIKDDLLGDPGRRLALALAEHCPIFVGGQKINHLSLLPFGGRGYLSTLLLFSPEITHAYWQAVRRGDLKSCLRFIRDWDEPLFALLKRQPGGFDAGLHGMMELWGLSTRWRRPPYHSLSAEELETFTHDLVQLGWRPSGRM